MQNILPHTVIPKMPEPYIPVQNRTPEGYPVCAFPPVMRDVIDALYNETGIPAELIAGAVLAAASSPVRLILRWYHHTHRIRCTVHCIY